MVEQIELQIRKYRKARGLTLTDLARLIGTTAQTISRLERSKMKLSVGWIDQIAEVLDVSPYLLLGAPIRPESTVLGTLDAEGALVPQSSTQLPAKAASLSIDAKDPIAVQLSRSIGRYDAGDVLIGDRMRRPSKMPRYYCDAFVGLPSGWQVLRRLEDRRGDLFTLAEMVPDGKIERDCEVLWVAPIALRVSCL